MQEVIQGLMITKYTLTKIKHSYKGNSDKLAKTLKEITVLKEHIYTLPTDLELEEATDQFVQQVMPDDLSKRLDIHTKRMEELTIIKPSSKLTKPSVAATPEGSLQRPSTMTRSASSTNITTAVSQQFTSPKVSLTGTHNLVSAAINSSQPLTASRSLPTSPKTPRVAVMIETVD